MTTIAYRAGVLAGDSQTSTGNVKMLDSVKVHRIHGYLIGLAGQRGCLDEFLQWFKDECKDELKKAPASILQDDDKYPVCALVVREKDKALFQYHGAGHPFRLYGKYAAIGSGDALAIGAMAFGASAVEAVRIAVKHDCNTGGKVRALTCQ